jgi:hypothetical protein
MSYITDQYAPHAQQVIDYPCMGQQLHHSVHLQNINDTTSLEENHCCDNDELKPFENNEIFPDIKVKMPSVPLSSSI